MAIGDTFTETVINQNLSNVGFTTQERAALRRMFLAIQSEFTETAALGLGDLSDVDLTGLADNETLTYDSSSETWGGE